MTFEDVRQQVLELPGVVEGMSYGTPGFRVRKRFFLRLREDNESIALNEVNDEEREELFAADPRTFFTTPHYDGYPIVLIRFAHVRPKQLTALLERSWRRLAPKRVLAAYDTGLLDLDARAGKVGAASPTKAARSMKAAKATKAVKRVNAKNGTKGTSASSNTKASRSS